MSNSMNQKFVNIRNDSLAEFARSNGCKKEEELHSFPKYIQLEASSVCNARCFMCPVNEWHREDKFMPQELFEKIKEELKEYTGWLEKVFLHNDGEPLLDKDLTNKIRGLKKAGIKFVEISSNASLMDAEQAKKLLEAGIDLVTFSIDASTKEVFEKTRPPLKFDECVSNIIGYIKLRDEISPSSIVRIRMTLYKSNSHEFNSLVSFWDSYLGKNLQDGAYGRLAHNWGHWLGENNSDALVMANQELNSNLCLSPWGTMIILSDGRVALCCCDYNADICLGNVKGNSIKEIWQSKKFREIRNLHLESGRKSMEKCVDCGTWDESAIVTKDNYKDLLGL